MGSTRAQLRDRDTQLAKSKEQMHTTLAAKDEELVAAKVNRGSSFWNWCESRALYKHCLTPSPPLLIFYVEDNLAWANLFFSSYHSYSCFRGKLRVLLFSTIYIHIYIHVHMCHD